MVNIAAIKAMVEGAEKLTATQLEFAKDRIVMGTKWNCSFAHTTSQFPHIASQFPHTASQFALIKIG